MKNLEFNGLWNDLQKLEYNLNKGKLECFKTKCPGEGNCNLIHYLIGKGKSKEYINNFCKK